MIILMMIFEIIMIPMMKKLDGFAPPVSFAILAWNEMKWFKMA